MSFSASAADERVLDVQLTDDTLTVSLRDGSRHLRAARLVSPPAQRNRSTAPELENCRRRLRHPLAGNRRGSSTEVCCVAHLHLGRQFARDKFAGCVV